MIHQKHVDYYIEQFKSGKIKFNKERANLIEYLERDVFSRDDVYFDDVLMVRNGISQCSHSRSS